MSYTVYILQCADNHTYVGITDNLEERIARHNKGWVPATAKKLPVKLMSYVVFEDKYKAYQFEKYLKSGSGRAFMKRHLV